MADKTVVDAIDDMIPTGIRPISALRAFVTSEASGGIVLAVAAVAAMVIANLPDLSYAYHKLLEFETGPALSPALGPMTVHLWINDGLMAIFFLLVGLEIKRELVDGRLSTWERRRLPFIAAFAGMAAPALVFLVLTRGQAGVSHGWAIPAATDIAFAMGLLSLLGKRVSSSLKLMLLTIAIVDDMGAVAIIALVYTAEVQFTWLAAAALVVFALFLLNRAGIRSLTPYVVGFFACWVFLLISGVHATIAGVVVAALVPFTPSPGAPDDQTSPLHRLEHAINPWVAFAIVPLFAFANAGVSLDGIGASVLVEPLVLGIALGLFAGKQIGIFGGIYAAVKLGFAEPPGRLSWLQIYGMALVAGIGFTMSLFIGGLAFSDPALVDHAKIGVLAGSILSGAAGFLILGLTPRRG